MEFPHARLMIFAKAPLEGQVKTRLIPALGEKAATTLHQQLCLHTLEMAVNAGLCPVQLWCAGDCNHLFFQHCAEHFPLTLHEQTGNDLGARMNNAFNHTLAENQPVVIIGTDCPALSAADLRDALNALTQGFDAVLGPAEDGGYVLLGLRNTAPTLFNDMLWGNAEVLAQTRKRLREADINWHEITQRWDVDRPEDVARLAHEALLKTGITRSELFANYAG